MADDEQMVMETEDSEGTPQKKGGKLKLIMIIVLIVLVGGGAGVYFVFGNQLKARFFGGIEQPVKDEKKRESIGPILSLEPFIFNIGGASGKFAKITLGVEVKDAKVMEEAKKMVPAIRDRTLSVLGSKGPEVLMDINNRNHLKKELLNAMKTLFKDDAELKSLYITDIIVQ
ncbi:MAG TPA: flagellar basal body-associated FliL family protein [Syntrophorhabdus sp.]|jgi:flagellar FliL protein|nr:flagellar basal body-associated FliL family protein [Syntrophorhabdus sp.]MDI9558286.1 flagellar basal body-associated FliL family protein [Pseudomonadota bacterium]OPX94419.1 MAG: flagellar basal body-associated protein FliL [Syntrophorhabdus sp. PtaB.Bin027]OQB78010.1 MAG: flagellar basal body-associated protein FliL [Deltaproteobacteria bacterium ADurb.Bin135]MBP8743704.1 flagellar basal body-associated FliL family protein [Syntrophorhabdus sp.]